jgi:ABC-type dipeptide/oligopeptide/nickel transport system permease component
VLPVGTLTLLATAAISRHQRSALLEVMPSDWMRTAIAKG